MNPVPLQECCLQRCASLCLSVPVLDSEKLKVVHEYLSKAYPLLHKIATKCNYFKSGKITVLFIPFLLEKGELYLTDQNISQVLQWIESVLAHEKCSELTKLIVNAPEGRNYLRFLPLIAKFPNIKRLQLCTWTTDDVLAAIGVHCTHLEILDAREDTGSAITDVGLGFLSHCKSLKMVLFSKIADEYDFEDKFKFTGKGIAMLLLTLKSIERIECPEYLMRDALHYIYQMNFQSPVLPLKCLLLGFPDVPVQTVSIVPYLCPYIDTLSIYVKSKAEAFAVSRSLKRLINLKKLIMSLEDSISMKSLGVTDFGHHLEFLMLESQSFSEEDICLLSFSCVQLNTLVLQSHSFGFDTFLGNRLTENELLLPFFPTLTTLEFILRTSVMLFKLINLKTRGIKALYCQHAKIYELETTIENIISNGGWSELQILVLPSNLKLTFNFIVENIFKLKNLKVLAVTMLNFHEENKLRLFLFKNCSLSVQICDYDDVPPPSKSFDII